MRTLALRVLCITFALASMSNNANALETIGIVKSVSGSVFLSNNSSNILAAPNMKLNRGDSVITGPQSNIGLIFEDDTVVSMGSNSEMKIEDFNFDPAQENLSFIAKLVQGTFSFISGQIAKLAPDQVKLETPDATLGVRGTKFLVQID